jgi:solute carrier family 13 (sodium-dependent dicarboxylate transporter), member 2/3/5
LSSGLLVGLLGFAGVLGAPLVALLPAALRWTAVGLLFTLGLWRLSLRRKPAAAAALTLSATLALTSSLMAMPSPARATLAATVWMAAWWITEVIPIGATSLLPLVLFPLLGVLPGKAVAASYADQNVFLFLGGFILALAIQRWGLHRRIALHVVLAVGTSLPRVVLGFMLASAFLSMWISNTATTLMMLPIALAVIASLGEENRLARGEGFASALLLGIAYSASIGGIATPIGTPPNIALLRILHIQYPDAPNISFGAWVVAFLPLVAVFLPVAWLVLTRVTHKLRGRNFSKARQAMRDEIREMGKGERRILYIFVATAVLWIFNADLNFGGLRIPGWAGLLEKLLGPPFTAASVHDATVAIAMAILTFVVRGDPDERRQPQNLMDWETARTLPWEILLLFGGGFALAAAYEASGLSAYIARSFAGMVSGAPPLLLVVAACLLLTFLTEVTSNTATTQVLLPVLASAANAMRVHPLLLMLPATISASCAFMLPIATPPNAVVFGSGEFKMHHMVRAGLWLNLIGVVLVTAVFMLWSSWVLGLDLHTVPAWAVK